ncbi:hypothetical protein I302_106952 [Kwoniella bestiolae CBS 10118]|uniref:Helicase C-terminal domain-containing protein n=1 Tax=Kwoniella bestiolae CBS 10118 TaxID=1296100 RepID=A0AAJ8KBN9_9TREE
MESMGHTVKHLEASLKSKERKNLIADFNATTKRDICLLSSIRVDGEGVSMVGAQACVCLDLMWNPSWHDQAMDRLHRPGQMKEVHVYMPITLNSYQVDIRNAQQLKKHFVHMVDAAVRPGGLSPSDIPPDYMKWLVQMSAKHGED